MCVKGFEFRLSPLTSTRYLLFIQRVYRNLNWILYYYHQPGPAFQNAFCSVGQQFRQTFFGLGWANR
jgi:hypothetical protein